MESFHEGSTDMDARIWGNLENYIDLAMIYVKLPMGEFFRLRQVCKEWNRLASDRKFLEESFRGPIPEPYFVVNSRKMGHRLLARDASSGQWSWTPMPSAKCAVAGLLCKYREASNSNCVFNLHTRVFHALPPAPETLLEDVQFIEPLVGITVDTAVHPYGFKVFVGGVEIGTRIYDSKSGAWTQKPSLHHSAFLVLDSKHQKKPYSFFYNGALYFRVWCNQSRMVDLQSYHLERDEWTEIESFMTDEPRWRFGLPWSPDQMCVFCDIGVWQGRLWYLRMRLEVVAGIGVLEYRVGVYHEDERCWVVSDRMPKDLKTWLMAHQEDEVADFGEEIEMQSVFCGQYVLMYNWTGFRHVTKRAVLYNLEAKTWEKLQLPPSWPRKVLGPGNFTASCRVDWSPHIFRVPGFAALFHIPDGVEGTVLAARPTCAAARAILKTSTTLVATERKSLQERQIVNVTRRKCYQLLAQHH